MYAYLSSATKLAAVPARKKPLPEKRQAGEDEPIHRYCKSLFCADAARSLHRAAKGTLEVFLRIGVVSGHFIGMITIESAINMRVVGDATEFITVKRRFQITVNKFALVTWLGEGQFHTLVGEIHICLHDALRVVVVGVIDVDDIANIMRRAFIWHTGRKMPLMEDDIVAFIIQGAETRV